MALNRASRGISHKDANPGVVVTETWRGALARGFDRALDRPGRQFLGLPLMHSEHIADQRLSFSRYAELGDSFVLGFARAHYRMIARFGRFPHRNAVLGRTSTAAELRAIEAGHAW